MSDYASIEAAFAKTVERARRLDAAVNSGASPVPSNLPGPAGIEKRSYVAQSPRAPILAYAGQFVGGTTAPDCLVLSICGLDIGGTAFIKAAGSSFTPGGCFLLCTPSRETPCATHCISR